jgi:ADP-ribosylglycohydrolase
MLKYLITDLDNLYYNSPMPTTPFPTLLSRITGCLLGGAVGDALGDPVEFLPLVDIRRIYGPQGIQGYTKLNNTGLAEFTDDTQMTLFTAEGLLQAAPGEDPIPSVYQAYLRWLRTQQSAYPGSAESGLLRHKELWKRKAPGRTCLTALSSHACGTVEKPINESKGCGGIMRAAPCGLLYPREKAFGTGARSAAITHGHPSGYLSSGFFAAMLADVLSGLPFQEAAANAMRLLHDWPDHEETRQAAQNAIDLVESGLSPAPEQVEKLGRAWVGEEALAISLYCALVYPLDFRSAVLLAVNHSGDSDSTGAITGNLLGAALGVEAIPDEWLAPLELRLEIEQMSSEIYQRLLEH